MDGLIWEGQFYKQNTHSQYQGRYEWKRDGWEKDIIIHNTVEHLTNAIRSEEQGDGVQELSPGQERIDTKRIAFTLKPWNYDDRLQPSTNINDTGGYVDALKQNQPRRRNKDKPYNQAGLID
jgi:hypothetical protein